MAVIVVGGHSHNIGKTSVACGLISAFAGWNWTALKISRHNPGVCPVNGPGCRCAPSEHPYCITPEENRLGGTDSSRFLAAGASRSYWVQVKTDGLGTAAPEILKIVGDSPFALIESNSILRYLHPDLYIVVLRFDVEDWKQSAREFFETADIAVAVGGTSRRQSWGGVPREALSRVPLVRVNPPDYVTGELINRVRRRLETVTGDGPV